MAWFRKDKQPLRAEDKRDVPGDVFDKCKGCGEILYRERLAKNLNVCPDCGYHLRISADGYLALLLEHGMVDRVVDRRKMKETVSLLLSHMTGVWPERAVAAVSDDA